MPSVTGSNELLGREHVFVAGQPVVDGLVIVSAPSTVSITESTPSSPSLIDFETIREKQ
jgi:hypothetical protein